MANIKIDKQMIKAWVKDNLIAVVFFATSLLLLIWIYNRHGSITELSDESDRISLMADSMTRDITSLRTIDKDFSELKANFDELRSKLMNFGSRTEIFSFFFEFEQSLGIKFTNQSVVDAYNLSKKTGISIDKDLFEFNGDIIAVEYNVILTTTLLKSMNFVRALQKCDRWVRVNKFEYKETKTYETVTKGADGKDIRNEEDRNVEVAINFVILGNIKFGNSGDA